MDKLIPLEVSVRQHQLEQKRKNPDKKLGRPSKLTSEIESKILEMRSKNSGINKIAKACGVGTQAVYKVIGADNSVPALHNA